MFSFHCTEFSYCVHMHNEEQVRYVMQFDALGASKTPKTP